MPAKSKKQLRFMQAVANNPAFAKKVGVPTKVGKEFSKEKNMKKGNENALMKKVGRNMAKADMQKMNPGMKKYEKGGEVNMSDEKLIKKVARAVNKATGRQDMLAKDKTGPQQEIGMDQRKAKGKFSKYHDRGKEEVALLESAKFAEQELENERKAEDKSKAPKFKKGGSVKAKRDGCAVRGKTRGRMV
jgi:hypothetical protein